MADTEQRFNFFTSTRFKDMNMISSEIFDTAKQVFDEVMQLREEGCVDYLTPISSAILFERMRCHGLALDFSVVEGPRDIFDAITSIEMEELADRIRCGDFTRRMRPDNDNDDTVMK